VSPVQYELGFYIPEEDILHSHRRENVKSYIALTGWALQWRRDVSPVRLSNAIRRSEEHDPKRLQQCSTTGGKQPIG
jgi:hypothetical protein